MKNINEFFTLPTDLKLIAKIADEKVYGSNTLNNKYIEIIENNILTKNVSKEITLMVKEKRIIPCFASKNLISFIAHKFSFYNHSFEKIAGLYLPQRNKIFIFMDHSMSMIFSGKDNSIARVTLHELLHMVSVVKSKEFWSLFKDELLTFYTKYYKNLFKLNDEEQIYKDNVLELIKLFYFSYEKGENIELANIYKLLLNFRNYSTLEEHKFNRLVKMYCSSILSYSKDFHIFLSNYVSFLDILKPIKETYDDIYGKITNVIFYQEISTPSEVICISTEVRINDNIKKAVRLIL